MFGKRGCVESFCSGEGIAKLAPYLFPDCFDRPTAPEALHDLAEGGHGPARAVLEEAARRTGQLCALLTDVFSPELIVLGSLARYLSPWWLDLVRRECSRQSLPTHSRQMRIVSAELGADLQDLSAVAPCAHRRQRRA